jgi:signal transduction histidine kinase
MNAGMKRRILVIDDEPRLAESLADLLREEGYEVDAAVGGIKGIECLTAKEYEVVITDLRMPEVDGFQVMDHVARSCPDTALIVITGHASTESAIAAIHQRVADYITKPFEFDYLIASIEKVFAQIEADQLRRDMIRMITHDIKVPLNSIMGFAQFVTDPATGKASERAPEFAEKIIRNSQRILGLLDNYLTQARVEGGKLEIAPHPMDLAGTLEEAARMVAGEFRRKDIAFEWELGTLHRPFEGDEPLLFRAVSNLLNNACKYTPRGGTARLTLAEDPAAGRVHIVVENSGEGIPAEEIANLFDKYTRSKTSRGIEGSGLGLFVVHHVALAHGGRATCTSDPGTCTRFILDLPFARNTTERTNGGG